MATIPDDHDHGEVPADLLDLWVALDDLEQPAEATAKRADQLAALHDGGTDGDPR